MFRICSRVNNCYVFTNGSPNDYLLDSTAQVQLVDEKAIFVFVGDANANHSEWLDPVSPTDRHWRDGLSMEQHFEVS